MLLLLAFSCFSYWHLHASPIGRLIQDLLESGIMEVDGSSPAPHEDGWRGEELFGLSSNYGRVSSSVAQRGVQVSFCCVLVKLYMTFALAFPFPPSPLQLVQLGGPALKAIE